MKNKTKYTNLFKNTFIFAIGNIGSRLILFILVPLYTNVLSADQYGIAELLFTMSELLIPIFTLTIYDAIIRFGLNDEKNRDTVVKNALLIWFVGMICSIGFILLCCKLLKLEQWSIYIYVYMIFRSLNFVEMNILKIENKNKIYAINSIIQTLILAIFNILFLAVFKLGIQGYLISNIIAFFVSDIIAFVFTELKISIKKGTVDYSILKNMLAFSIPMIFTNISWWIVNSSDKFMVKLILTSSSLGLYTVAAKIPSLINVFTNIFSQAWGISTIKEIESSNDSNYYVNVFEKITVLTFFACILLVSIMKYFMMIYVGKDFYSAWIFVPLLLVSAVFASIVSFCGSLYSALKRTLNSMVTTIIGAIINIIVNFILIYRLGVMGAVIGTVVSYFVVSIIRLIDIKRYMEFNFDNKKLALNIIIILMHSIIVSMDVLIIPISIITLFIYIYVNKTQLIEIKNGTLKMLRRKKNEN